jgi:hypothetical protein
MAIGDKAGLETVELINEKTIPMLVDALHVLLERVNGAVVTITINIPPRDYPEAK